MVTGLVLVVGLTLCAQTGRPSAEQLLALHREDATTYTIYRDTALKQKLELRKDPVYRWTNPTRVGGQTGDVFVWTYAGRPEVIASIFSHPSEPGHQRVMCHEFHSLSDAVLTIDRASANRWQPQAAGLDMKPIPGAPAPAATAPARLAQLRAVARDFNGHSLSDQEVRWELRMLPQPLIRYESQELGVTDGALFALVSSAGTDPEIILAIEARATASGPRWEFGAARFSDMSLWLKHKGHDVWSAIRGPENGFNFDAKQRFRFYQDRSITELEPAGK